MKNYDVVVIGAGPAGYEAALELAKGGFKTLLVDKNKEKIGGTCLNEGCVPAKNYLQSAEFISKSSYFKECGLDMDIKSFDLGRLREKTLLLKNELRSGVFWLLEQAGVELLYGNASFVDANTIDISGEKITFKRAIIATGSKPKNLAELPLDNKNIISSSGVFELTSLPSSIAIIGGGAIACEFATFFSSFGAKVTLIVRGSQLLSKEDEDISKTLLRAFKKQNITVFTSAVIQEAEVKNGEVELFIKEIKEPIRCKIVLCASGRTPFTDELNHQKAGVESDERGYIKVSKSYVASQKNIYAIGDCIDSYGYAHTAYAQAKIVARNIINNESKTISNIVPSVIFSNPQIATCGLRESEAKSQNIEIEVKKAFFKTNAKAKICGDDSGFAKIAVCVKTGVVLGAGIVGVQASEIIHEFVVAIEKKLTAKEFVEIIHAHPSLSEIVRYIN